MGPKDRERRGEGSEVTQSTDGKTSRCVIAADDVGRESPLILEIKKVDLGRWRLRPAEVRAAGGLPLSRSVYKKTKKQDEDVSSRRCPELIADSVRSWWTRPVRANCAGGCVSLSLLIAEAAAEALVHTLAVI